METAPPAITLQLQDDPETFTITVVQAATPRRVGLFAAGSGGNLLRHLPLLQSLANRGYTMVAPHFAKLAPFPKSEELHTLIRRLELSADRYAPPGRPIIGVGHSIGTVMLLTLAGAEAWTVSGKVTFESKWKLERLAPRPPDRLL
jgi:hypothetical protein